MEQLDILVPITQVSSHTLFQGYLVRYLTKAGLRAMHHILAIRNSIILSYQAIVLIPLILGGLIYFWLVVRQNSSPSLLFAGKYRARVAIITWHNLMDGKSLDIGSSPFPIIFILKSGQEATPLFTGKLVIVLIFVLHLVPHGYG